MKLDRFEDIREYLDYFKGKELKVKLFHIRSPFEIEPQEGGVDEYSLVYISDGFPGISEQFFSLRFKNLTEKIGGDVNPVTNNCLEQIWAQIGHRKNFIDERGIKNQFSYNSKIIEPANKLPDLPYKFKVDLTLQEIMALSKKNFWDYTRHTYLWGDSSDLKTKRKTN